jgi:putative membrane protein
MLSIALVLAGLAALVHVYIFWLESLAFATVGRKAFGISAEQAEVVRPWAYNQGFYNLFLAVGTTVGLMLTRSNEDVGAALVTFGTGSMLAAALVLVTSDPSKARGAVVQGTFPAIALVFLGIWALA